MSNENVRLFLVYNYPHHGPTEQELEALIQARTPIKDIISKFPTWYSSTTNPNEGVLEAFADDRPDVTVIEPPTPKFYSNNVYN